jgi:hypothetical protein
VIFAILDGNSSHITCEHLKSALALWRYSVDSARIIFGESEANPRAQQLLDFLEVGRKSKEAICSDCFKRDLIKPEIDRLLQELMAASKVASFAVRGGPWPLAR